MNLARFITTAAIAALVTISVPQLSFAANNRSGAVAGDPVSGTKGMDAVITQYLNLKDALVADNSQGAASAGGELYKAIAALGKETMSALQKATYNDIVADAKENAEHISKNAGNIKHQREHFQNLGDDIRGLLKSFGSSKTLYREYCPMKKAYWYSEEKAIKNPYYGKSMLTCGQVKETIKP